MSRDYYVVLEHTQNAGGYAGIRVIRSYIDKAKFLEKNTPMNENYSVLAEGITEKEAEDLFCQTPEICRLTAAVKRIFEYASSSGIPSRDTITREINAATRRIADDRQYRQENDLQLDEGSFAFVKTKGSGNKTMDMIYEFIDNNYYTNTGAIIDLNFAVNHIIFFITDITNG